MAAAAIRHECQPRSASFAGALQTVSGLLQQASVSSPRELHGLRNGGLGTGDGEGLGTRIDPAIASSTTEEQALKP